MDRKYNPYLNAKEVLPKELLNQLYEQGFEGVYLYIPSRNREKLEQQYAYIYYLRFEEGLTINAISEKVHLTERRVKQILEYYRKRHPEPDN